MTQQPEYTPGWYPTGDGNVRWHDGHQWTEHIQAASGSSTSARSFSGWWLRFGAYVLDSLIMAAGYLVILLFAGPPTTEFYNAQGDLVDTQINGLSYSIMAVALVIWVVLNFVYLQGRTGQSIGKRAVGITVLDATTQQPIGMGRAVGRYFAHILDALPCYLGFLWPLWDAEKRTFADMIVKSRVYKV